MSNLSNWHSMRKVDTFRNYVKDKGNIEQIELLYSLNQQISYLVFPVLSNFELLLRNKVCQFLENNNQSDSWYVEVLNESSYSSETKEIINEKLQDYITREVALKNELEQVMINSTNIKKAKYKVADINNKLDNLKESHKGDLLVSDLSFGIWCHIINKCPNRNDLMLSLNLDRNHRKWIKYFFKIKDLRNRICHHENVIKSLDDFFDVYNNAMDLLEIMGGKEYKIYVIASIEKMLNKTANNKKVKYIDVFNKIKTEIEEIHLEKTLEE
ncbi:MAG: Abi family protein [Alphaproteobacteria bacterium]|nr:Abi family protein [Alphaproteobacteria bacterium]